MGGEFKPAAEAVEITGARRSQVIRTASGGWMTISARGYFAAHETEEAATDYLKKLEARGR